MGSPALIAGQASALLRRHNSLVAAAAQFAVGGVLSDGGSTQASGASGALNFDVDATAIIDACVNGEQHILAAATDADSDAGAAVVWGATSGKFIRFACVLETGTDNDTPAIMAIAGSVADAAVDATAPTQAEIDTGVGHSNWTSLGNVLIERSADTTLVFTVEGSAKFGAIRQEDRIDLAETESAWQE